MKFEMVVSIIPSFFPVFFLLILLKQYPVDTCDKFSCRLMKAWHIFYNVQSDNKCENELKDWGWDTDNMFPGQEY